MPRIAHTRSWQQKWAHALVKMLTACIDSMHEDTWQTLSLKCTSLILVGTFYWDAPPLPVAIRSLNVFCLMEP